MSKLDIRKRKLYMAYGCFLLSGSIFTLIGVISFIPMNTGTAGGIGLLLLVPLSIVALGAICCGFVLSYLLRPHTPLVFLSIVSLVFILEVISEAGSSFVYNSVFIIYSLVSVGIPLWWLLFKRNKYVDVA